MKNTTLLRILPLGLALTAVAACGEDKADPGPALDPKAVASTAAVSTYASLVHATYADAAAKAGNTDLLKQVFDLPIPLLIHIDGNTAVDFCNLQAGRNVDAAHRPVRQSACRLVSLSRSSMPSWSWALMA